MVIMTAKVPKRRLLLIVLLLIAAAVVLALCLHGAGSEMEKPTKSSAQGATNEARIAFLEGYGWQVEPEPVETLSLTLPKELEEPYLSYNVLQRAQGFDLEPCCGKTVERCTYTVKNHPSGKVCQADLYICGGEIVAGDILCTGEGGFIAPLAFPKDA